jgi:hypothetical protein
MKKITILALAAGGLLALAGSAQAKEIASLKVCGASGCNTVTDREALKNWEQDAAAGPQGTQAPGAQPFYTLELGFADGDGNIFHTERAYWLPASDMFKFKNTVDTTWWKSSPNQTSMYEKATAGLDAFTPKVSKVTVKGKAVADPNSYLKLLGSFPYVGFPKGKLHLFSIVLTPSGDNPFLALNGKTTLRYDAARRLLIRADGYFRIPQSVGKLVLQRASLTATTSGAGGGHTGLYAGLGVGGAAALAVLAVARRKRIH